jgi:hypothetical protein
MPFTANAVNLRGKPAKIGGTVAAVAGWVVLFGALAVALLLGAILQAIFPVGAVVGWVVGGLIATVGVAVALLLLFGGRALRRSGTNAAESARLDALGTLAAYHQGIITSANAAEALGVDVDQADAYLTSLAKQPDSGISLEVDDDGRITYRFARYAPPPVWPADAKVRIDAPLPAFTQSGGRSGETVVPRGKTELMPQAIPTGPAGTMVVPSRPPQGVRIAEPEVVPVDGMEEDEAAADPRRARSE